MQPVSPYWSKSLVSQFTSQSWLQHTALEWKILRTRYSKRSWTSNTTGTFCWRNMSLADTCNFRRFFRCNRQPRGPWSWSGLLRVWDPWNQGSAAPSTTAISCNCQQPNYCRNISRPPSFPVTQLWIQVLGSSVLSNIASRIRQYRFIFD